MPLSHVARRGLLLTASVLLALAVGVPLEAKTRVTLEVVATDRFAIAEAQAWAKELGELGFAAVRIRLAGAGERPQPEISGEPGDPTRRVTALLTSGDVLLVPGAKFRRGDGASIAAWLKKLEENAPEEEPPAAFGLSANELVELHTTLAQRVSPKTQGQPVSHAANAIVRELSLAVRVSEAAKQRIAAAEPIADELHGLSTGTALAAILRPLGLGVAPVKEQGRIVLAVDDFRNLPQTWPIGWPLEKKEVDVVPKLLEFLPVEIIDTPVDDTVAAIAGRLGMPVLYDHNGLARNRIDPSREKVNIPETRTYYRRVLDRSLIPLGLMAEVRLDEGEKPFLWIGALKQ